MHHYPRPPTLPSLAGESIQSFRPSEAYLRYVKMYFWLTVIVFDTILFTIWFVVTVGVPRIGGWLLPLVLIVAVVPELVGYLAIHLQFDTTWYVLSQRSLRIRNGIWTIREATITFENIQNVTVESGPIERMFGIGNVVVDTAGGGSGSKGPHGETLENLHRGEIAGVSNAAEIRQVILSRLSLSKSGGLGDEQAGRSREWLSEHVAVLIEIRDALKQTKAL